MTYELWSVHASSHQMARRRGGHGHPILSQESIKSRGQLPAPRNASRAQHRTRCGVDASRTCNLASPTSGPSIDIAMHNSIQGRARARIRVRPDLHCTISMASHLCCVWIYSSPVELFSSRGDPLFIIFLFQTLNGRLSAVSAPITATKYSLESA